MKACRYEILVYPQFYSQDLWISRFTLQRFIGDTSSATMTRSLPERALGPIAGESRGTQAQH
jgi:hypothetical protein